MFFSVRNKNKSLFKNGLNSLKLDLVARERKREAPGALHGVTLTRLGDKLQENLPTEKLRHVTYLR